MSNLLTEGLTDAWRNLYPALRLFWPVLAVISTFYAISLPIAATWFSSDLVDSALVIVAWVLGMLVVFVYVFFILCQGAVGWHRRILLDEHPGWISPVPRRRAFQYALAVFLFALLALAVEMVVGLFLTPLLSSLMLPTLQNLDTAGSEVDKLEAVWKAMMPVQIAMVIFSIILTFAVLTLARSWLLVFPHISIRTVEPAFGEIKDRLDTPSSLVTALTVVYLVPSVFSLAYMMLIPFKTQQLTGVAITSSIVEYAISMFCFLWGLSILSKTYATVAAGKIPYERAS